MSETVQEGSLGKTSSSQSVAEMLNIDRGNHRGDQKVKEVSGGRIEGVKEYRSTYRRKRGISAGMVARMASTISRVNLILFSKLPATQLQPQLMDKAKKTYLRTRPCACC